ncbi:Putative serine protease HhoA precursor [Planctomycetes bacterium Poly30]|uniref:Serine protease HhoA n=1 Tax=Saltatorellus ferox TaxID=2528018 RepID=A0A518ERZ7_9BACT|nr:Putative serine protease HhoA precursor [Planctomycetes bacterium Poly30]
MPRIGAALLSGLTLAAVTSVTGASSPAAALQIAPQLATGGPSGPEERARADIYDSLQKLPRETPVSLVAQAVGPSVVYVETEMVRPVRTIFGLQNETRNGSGSGVVIHPSGLIITNYHVVENAREIRVSFEGNPESYPAERISFVREEDLALLKIQLPDQDEGSRPLRRRARGGLRAASDRAGADRSDGGNPDAGMTDAKGPTLFPTVRMGTSADLMPGERVVAIGSPHGQTYTVSTGIISGLHRDVSVPGRDLNFRGLIQTDASINFGNSGGPLLNIHGELIGINTVMNASAENIGFAIPVDRVRQVLEDVLFPNARRTWLGFDVTEDASGLVVSKVWPMGPAEGTGLCEGDRVVALDRTAVPDAESYLLQSLQVDVGRPVDIQFARGGETFTAPIAGWDELNGFFFRDVGLTVKEILLNQNRQPFLQVEAVLPGSPADELGVLEGDLLQAARPRTRQRYPAIALSDKATLKTILDGVPAGTEIEIDAYRDMNGDLRFSNNELLKGVLVR